MVKCAVGFFFFIFDSIFSGAIKERKHMADKFDKQVKAIDESCMLIYLFTNTVTIWLKYKK